MPNRIIRESARTSATLYLLSHGAERMFWRLTTVADDFGRFESDPRILRAACFPLWGDRIKVSQVAEWYAEMETAELVTTYAVAGKRLGFFTTWERHQQTRAKRSKHPAPTPDSICSHMCADVPEKREARSEESRIEEARSETRSTAPVVLTDDQFITALRANPAYEGIDLDRELAKMDAFLLTPKGRGRKKTRGFIVNWLNRADRPMPPGKPPGFRTDMSGLLRFAQKGTPA